MPPQLIVALAVVPENLGPSSYGAAREYAHDKASTTLACENAFATFEALGSLEAAAGCRLKLTLPELTLTSGVMTTSCASTSTA
eukprot:scaffold13821_cov68-Phaeocystis_antarctica.AAC.2